MEVITGPKGSLDDSQSWIPAPCTYHDLLNAEWFFALKNDKVDFFALKNDGAESFVALENDGVETFFDP